MFVFYYSGHARAEAIDLGERPLVLDALRAALDKVPATVRVVVLDACQSGAFSKVKGAIPAADFSISSARRLATEGSAVIASSTGSELSQESPDLGGSYFTHHFAVGLRGAADADRDGRVMLSEAYQYAYHRTILATAATAVGRQHPVLETRLKGHGDVTLSYPSAASAQLALSGHRAARLHRARRGGGRAARAVRSRGPGRAAARRLRRHRAPRGAARPLRAEHGRGESHPSRSGDLPGDLRA
jgi:uncharacterized caspase-like protein